MKTIIIVFTSFFTLLAQSGLANDSVCMCNTMYNTGSEACQCVDTPYTNVTPDNSGGWRYGDASADQNAYCISNGGKANVKSVVKSTGTCDFPVYKCPKRRPYIRQGGSGSSSKYYCCSVPKYEKGKCYIPKNKVWPK